MRYVLCIKLGDTLEQCSYKLYEVGRHGLEPSTQSPVQVATDSQSAVYLDSRRLLCLPPSSALPPAFPHTLAIDLSAVLKKAREFSSRLPIAPELYQTAEETEAMGSATNSERKADDVVSAGMEAIALEDSSGN